MEYISYLKIIDNIARLKKGDVVYVVSDILNLVKVSKRHGEGFNRDLFINKLQKKIGVEGTLLIPTFNWDFCKGIPFDYEYTPSKTGALGNCALKRNDFLRTKHPIYSFAVWGKDAKMLVEKQFDNSFGIDSIFDYMCKVSAKALIIDLPTLAGLTFIHHIEQVVGVPYRYEKVFEAPYIRKDRKKVMKQCTMYVRDLDMNPQHIDLFQPMSRILEQLNISQCQSFNGIPFRTVILRELFPIIRADILYNDSRNLYKYKGQKEGIIDEILEGGCFYDCNYSG